MLKLFWPDVETEKGRMHSVLYGAIFMGIQALACFTQGLIELLPSLDPNDKGGSIGFRVIHSVSYLIVALVFVALSNKIWHKFSLLAAGLGLLIATLEVILHLRQTFTVEAGGSYLLLLLSVHGIRGVQAMRRAAVTQAKRN